MKQDLRCGTTALIAILMNNDLIIGNLGDSSAILIGRTGGISLTINHDASNITEMERIQSAGGHIIKVGNVWRVQGMIAVTRSIGDPQYKQYLISNPQIFNYKINSSHSYLLLASDGLWNVIHLYLS